MHVSCGRMSLMSCVEQALCASVPLLYVRIVKAFAHALAHAQHLRGRARSVRVVTRWSVIPFFLLYCFPLKTQSDARGPAGASCARFLPGCTRLAGPLLCPPPRLQQHKGTSNARGQAMQAP